MIHASVFYFYTSNARHIILQLVVKAVYRLREIPRFLVGCEIEWSKTYAARCVRFYSQK